jgi:hypothetical protein
MAVTSTVTFKATVSDVRTRDTATLAGASMRGVVKENFALELAQNRLLQWRYAISSRFFPMHVSSVLHAPTDFLARTHQRVRGVAEVARGSFGVGLFAWLKGLPAYETAVFPGVESKRLPDPRRRNQTSPTVGRKPNGNVKDVSI